MAVLNLNLRLMQAVSRATQVPQVKHRQPIEPCTGRIGLRSPPDKEEASWRFVLGVLWVCWFFSKSVPKEVGMKFEVA